MAVWYTSAIFKARIKVQYQRKHFITSRRRYWRLYHSFTWVLLIFRDLISYRNFYSKGFKCFSGDCKCVVTNKFEFKIVQGKEIMQIKSMKVDFSVQGMRLHLSNLFNGNKVLGKVSFIFSKVKVKEKAFIIFWNIFSGQTVNQFLNKNALQVVDELKEDIGDALSKVFIEILNNAFRHMPTELWLAD